MEKQIGRKIWVLRSNNGGEYTDGGLSDFCAQEGIRGEFSVPYNPQRNEVSEKKNRVIVGDTRVMIHDQGLPLFLWVEPCNSVFIFRTGVLTEN